jgi:hypothetical protein
MLLEWVQKANSQRVSKMNAIGVGPVEQWLVKQMALEWVQRDRAMSFFLNSSFERKRNKEIIASESVITFPGFSSAIQ